MRADPQRLRAPVVVLLALPLLCTAPARAQSPIAGTWEGQGTGPWRLVLNVNGGSVTGRIDPPGVEIFDGKTDGETITFKALSPDGDRTHTFTARIDRDVLAFTRTVQVRLGGNAGGTGMFGARGLAQFTARRLSDTDLAAEVRGRELAASLNLPAANVKAEGRIFLPERTQRYRSVITITLWGLGSPLYEDPDIRQVAASTDAAVLLVRLSEIGPAVQQRANRFGPAGVDALMRLLQQLAAESGHAELATSPLVLWGHSAGAALGVDVALTYPQRTIGFVRYHSGGGVSMTNARQLASVPALEFVGGKDNPRLQQDAEEFWRTGRTAGAQWAYVFEPSAEHMAAETVVQAHTVLIPWISSVMRLRLPEDPSRPLREIPTSDGWLGDRRTGQIRAAGAAADDDASWFPDRASAEGFRDFVARQK